jgi:hypothetical protein
MKKLQKKLTLSRETLRNLSGHELQGIVGGVTNTCCNSSSETGDSCVTCNASSRCTAYCTSLTACC